MLTVIMVMNVTAKSYSQAGNFNIKAKEITLKALFETIKSQSDYRFMYNNDLVNDNQTVSISVTEASIEEVLNSSFRGKNLEYNIVGEKIIIKPAEEQKPAQQQDNEVKGKVTDEE